MESDEDIRSNGENLKALLGDAAAATEAVCQFALNPVATTATAVAGEILQELQVA